MQSIEFLKVGRLVNTHGIRGEVRVLVDTDFPEKRFASGSKVLLQHPSLSEPLELTVESSRPHKNVLLVKFAEWNNINQAEPFKGGQLVVRIGDALPNEEGEYYFHQIIGCEVVTTEGRLVGKVKEILPLPANDVWVVQPRAGKEILIPYIESIVKHVDVANKRITIEWMEGLGDLGTDSL
jgi:16S rRNA processing protein RimM